MGLHMCSQIIVFGWYVIVLHRMLSFQLTFLCHKVMLALGTLVTFTFYQWTQVCTSKLMFFLSASALFFELLMLAGASFLILFISKKPGGLELLFSKDHLCACHWGSMYNMLKEGQLYFAVALWINMVI
jgi:hypothetical protein